MSPGRWAEANAHWRHNRSHPHGVAEHFAWGTVLWAPTGVGPLGIVVAAPEEPVDVAHRLAEELAATHLSTGGVTAPMSRRAMWGGVVGFVPTVVVVGNTPLEGATLPVAAAVGVATAFGIAQRRRLRTSRRAWKHLSDPQGASRLFPHLRWLTDLTEEVPDQAEMVWSGVREMLWVAPNLTAAVTPVQQVSVALARTAQARRSRDAAAIAGMPDPDLSPDLSRLDDIAAGVVGALGFEEEVYRGVTDDMTGRTRAEVADEDESEDGDEDGDGDAGSGRAREPDEGDEPDEPAEGETRS